MTDASAAPIQHLSPLGAAAARLNALLAEQPGLTVATAESCTGGGVAHAITAVPGSSAYFLGGIVAYANDAKASLLGVPREVLETRGAVSGECVEAMAEGARRAFGADLAVATTGIAGPTGGTPRKPVGLVYVAVAGPRGADCREFRFGGDRAAVIAAAIDAALRMLVEAVEQACRGRGGGPGSSSSSSSRRGGGPGVHRVPGPEGPG